jgi:hypothetical protein
MGRVMVVCLCAVLCPLVIASCGRPSVGAGTVGPGKRASDFVRLLAAGDFAVAAKAFDPTMAAALPADKLQQAWNALIAQAGPFQSQTGVRTATEQGFAVAHVTCRFAQRSVDVKVVLNRDGQIAGLWFMPAS